MAAFCCTRPVWPQGKYLLQQLRLAGCEGPLKFVQIRCGLDPVLFFGTLQGLSLKKFNGKAVIKKPSTPFSSSWRP